MGIGTRITPLVVIFVLAGCASTPRLMPTPNIYLDTNGYPASSVPQNLRSNKIDLLYVTDRVPETSDEGKLVYGYGRSSSVGFGSAIVEIGDGVTWPELVEMSGTAARQSSPLITVTSVTEAGRFPPTPHPFSMVDGALVEDPEVRTEDGRVAAQFREEIYRRMAETGRNEIFIFVHGYNNSFDWAAASVAELWHFLGRRGVPLLYSWPAGSGGLFGYFVDRESGEFTIYHLKKLIRLLASFPKVKGINIVSHSRGTDVTTTALRELIIEARAAGNNPRSKYRIDNLIMAAPDIDFSIVRQRLIAEKIGPAFGQITVYTTDKDQALGISQMLMSGTRFGRVRAEDLSETERAIFKQVKNVAFIDVKGSGGGFGHSYYLDNPSTSSDIIRVINTGSKPGTPDRPLTHRMMNFWEMPVEYPGVSE